MAAGQREVAELRRNLQKELEALEHTIFNVERVYLEQTSHYGNLVQGWDLQNYLKTQRLSTLHSASVPKKVKPLLKDRIFSLSSTTSEAQKLLCESEEVEEVEPSEERLRRVKKGLVKTVGRKPSKNYAFDSRDSWKTSIDKLPASRPKNALKEPSFRKGNKSNKNSLKKLKKKLKKT